MTTDPAITLDDVEDVREEVLESIPVPDGYDDASAETFRAGWIDAAIAFDRRLTDPEFFRDTE